MLYVTTREQRDAFTAYRAATESFPAESGLFIPFRMPVFGQDWLQQLLLKSCQEVIAEILNLFFNTKLTAWDVECAIGRYPIRSRFFKHKIVVCETWHNHKDDFSFALLSLANIVRKAESESVGNWLEIAIRIAALFGLFTHLYQSQNVSSSEVIDISVAAGDFSSFLAAFYARKMGLPIGMILCGCTKNMEIFDLFHQGQYSAPRASVPINLERLIYDSFGPAQTLRFVECVNNQETYSIPEAMLSQWFGTLYCAVVSEQRIGEIVCSFTQTTGYTLEHDAACAYGALQDYRASTGESRITLILSERIS